MDPTTTDAPATTSEGVEPTTQPVAPAADAPAVTPPAEPTPTTEPTGDEPSPGDDNSTDAWLQSKGIDPGSPEAVAKLADMARNAEKRMHESTTQASELRKALEGTDTPQTEPGELDFDEETLNHPVVKQLVEEINSLKQGQSAITLQSKVNDFFQSNPDARDQEAAMAKIVTDDPTINTLVRGGYIGIDKLYAMAKGSDATREATIRTEGGKEALERVADKQSGRAVTGKATSSDVTPAKTDAFLDGFNSVK